MRNRRSYPRIARSYSPGEISNSTLQMNVPKRAITTTEAQFADTLPEWKKYGSGITCGLPTTIGYSNAPGPTRIDSGQSTSMLDRGYEARGPYEIRGYNHVPTTNQTADTPGQRRLRISASAAASTTDTKAARQDRGNASPMGAVTPAAGLPGTRCRRRRRRPIACGLLRRSPKW